MLMYYASSVFDISQNRMVTMALEMVTSIISDSTIK